MISIDALHKKTPTVPRICRSTSLPWPEHAAKYCRMNLVASVLPDPDSPLQKTRMTGWRDNSKTDKMSMSIQRIFVSKVAEKINRGCEQRMRARKTHTSERSYTMIHNSNTAPQIHMTNTKHIHIESAKNHASPHLIMTDWFLPSAHMCENA